LAAILAGLPAHVKKRSSIRWIFSSGPESGRDKNVTEVSLKQKKIPEGFLGKKAVQPGFRVELDRAY
jgi:hypothetical protein